jgi:hypothetical protein
MYNNIQNMKHFYYVFGQTNRAFLDLFLTCRNLNKAHYTIQQLPTNQYITKSI